jgi:hypothetical protein
MPDYSLFGDEHVRQYQATGAKIGHDWNNTSVLVLHTIRRARADGQSPRLGGQHPADSGYRQALRERTSP